MHMYICGCITYEFVYHAVYELNGCCTYGMHVVHVSSTLRGACACCVCGVIYTGMSCILSCMFVMGEFMLMC